MKRFDHLRASGMEGDFKPTLCVGCATPTAQVAWDWQTDELVVACADCQKIEMSAAFPHKVNLCKNLRNSVPKYDILGMGIEYPFPHPWWGISSNPMRLVKCTGREHVIYLSDARFNAGAQKEKEC